MDITEASEVIRSHVFSHSPRDLGSLARRAFEKHTIPLRALWKYVTAALSIKKSGFYRSHFLIPRVSLILSFCHWVDASIVDLNEQMYRRVCMLGELREVDFNEIERVMSELSEKVLGDPDFYASNAGIPGSPLTYMFLNALHNMRVGVRAESVRVALVGRLGAGKTTLAILSILLALKSLGMSVRDAMEVIEALIIKNMGKLLEVMMVSENTYIPFIIFDDAYITLGKYIGWAVTASKEEIKLYKNITKLVRLMRENIGMVVYTSQSKDDLAKSVREAIDYTITEVSIVYMGMKKVKPEIPSPVTTLWISTRRIPEVTIIADDRARERTLYTHVTATTHPPLYTPRRLYEMIIREKLRERKQIALELASMEKQQTGEGFEEEEITM